MDKKSPYFKDRVNRLSHLKAGGVNVYPKFSVSMNLKSSREIHWGGQWTEIAASARIFSWNFGTVNHGDIAGVTGFPGKGKTGELIIYPKELEVLSPCLHPMPNLPKELAKFSPGSPRDPHKYILKQEARARSRFLDLILNKDVREIFEARLKIISYMRRFLENLDFQEVETPILDSIPGVGAGCPFMTKYKDMKLYLRVAPEVNLKKLLMGGLDRVYEMGKQFRNESIDATHNPEFTSCELYMTYADYNDMMELTEQLLSGLVKELTGSLIVKCQSNGLDKEPINIDFTPPFRLVYYLYSYNC